MPASAVLLAACSGTSGPSPASPSPREITPGPSTPAATSTAAPADAATVLRHVDWTRVVPMDCGRIPVVVDQVLVADVTADGVPDALVRARCDAAAGSPPSSLFAYAGGSGGPTALGSLVTDHDDLLLGTVAVAQGVVTVKATGWSGPDVPRCCPDVHQVLRWRWDGSGFTPLS